MCKISNIDKSLDCKDLSEQLETLVSFRESMSLILTSASSRMMIYYLYWSVLLLPVKSEDGHLEKSALPQTAQAGEVGTADCEEDTAEEVANSLNNI